VVKVKRDKLAAELRELYPGFVTTIAGLLGRIAANDAEPPAPSAPQRRIRDAPQSVFPCRARKSKMGQ
jgi:hypothetical protein